MNATADSAWPLTGDRCEPNVPHVGEMWSALTGAAILVGGAVSLFTSTHSDDTIDLVSSVVAINGAFSMLSHSTQLDIFGSADSLTICIGALLYVKINIVTSFPQLNELPVCRGAINLMVIILLALVLSWNKYTVPGWLIHPLADPFLIVLGVCLLVALVCLLKLAYGNAYWHLGHAKRIFLRATFFHCLGILCWFLENTQMHLVHQPGGCDPLFTLLHPIWHLCEAHALTAWIAFLKYHRGHFYGFEVEFRGKWWCPYAVWLEPADSDRANANPIIRHARSQKRATQAGRRNTYIDPKVLRTSWHARHAWRGQSFFKTSPAPPDPPISGENHGVVDTTLTLQQARISGPAGLETSANEGAGVGLSTTGSEGSRSGSSVNDCVLEMQSAAGQQRRQSISWTPFAV